MSRIDPGNPFQEGAAGAAALLTPSVRQRQAQRQVQEAALAEQQAQTEQRKAQADALRESNAKARATYNASQAVRAVLQNNPQANIDDLMRVGGPEAIPIIKDMLDQRKSNMEQVATQTAQQKAMTDELVQAYSLEPDATKHALIDRSLADNWFKSGRITAEQHDSMVNSPPDTIAELRAHQLQMAQKEAELLKIAERHLKDEQAFQAHQAGVYRPVGASGLLNTETGATAGETGGKLTGAPAEYEYAVAHGYKGSFEQYQNEDANRKRSVTNILPAASGGMGNVISDALGRATMTMPQTRRNQVINTVNQMITRGDEASARATIRQAALESEPVAVRQQVGGRREVMNSLSEIQGLLKKVPTNLMAGTIEDIARKLGTSTNTEYVKLGNRLSLLNQSYRRSMTGAQFSIPEAQEYGRIFPNYSTTAPVNTALIESLIDAFGANDSTYWKYKLGPGWSDSESASGNGSGGGTSKAIVQQNKTTGAFRYSTDGGKTWLNGKPPQ
jgi:hypothetical protein